VLFGFLAQAYAAAAPQAGWITAALGTPGAVMVILCLVSGLARVVVAGAYPTGEKRVVEQSLAFFTYPLAAVALVVILTRFAQLAK
jgi:hypothetical protein